MRTQITGLQFDIRVKGSYLHGVIPGNNRYYLVIPGIAKQKPKQYQSKTRYYQVLPGNARYYPRYPVNKLCYHNVRQNYAILPPTFLDGRGMT